MNVIPDYTNLMLAGVDMNIIVVVCSALIFWILGAAAAPGVVDDVGLFSGACDALAFGLCVALSRYVTVFECI